MLIDFVFDAIGSMGGKTERQLQFIFKTQEWAIRDALETLKANDMIVGREVNGIIYYYQTKDGKEAMKDESEKGSGNFGSIDLKPNLKRYRESKAALQDAGRGISTQYPEGLSVSDLESLLDGPEEVKPKLRRKS